MAATTKPPLECAPTAGDVSRENRRFDVFSSRLAILRSPSFKEEVKRRKRSGGDRATGEGVFGRKKGALK